MYQSFMDFCDDAEIATEGAVYEISSYAKILSKRVNLLQIQLKNNAGDRRSIHHLTLKEIMMNLLLFHLQSISNRNKDPY